MNEGEDVLEEIVSLRTTSWYTRWYWLVGLWLVAVGVFTGIGYFTGGAGAPPKLLAVFGEAWSSTFGEADGEFVQIIDTSKFSPPETLFREPDRVFSGKTFPARRSIYSGAVTSGVSSRKCAFDNEDKPDRNHVVINEIAWMGGLEGEDLGASDEWIELKNISAYPIDISGWWLLDGDDQIRILFPTGSVLSPGGFYLLERTDDNSIPGLVADLIYAGSLSNQDEGLRLFNENCGLEDEVLAYPDWPAGDSSNRRTMERSRSFSWHTYSGTVRDGVLGTPGLENSLPVLELVDEYREEQKSTVAATEEESFSLCSQEDLGEPTQEVLINEVSWAGRSDNTSEEWIEIYNPGGSGLSLAGWQLLDKENSIVVIFSEGDAIEEYLLLRRILTSDDPEGVYTVGSAVVDKTYTGVIQNSDEALRLFDSGCRLVDEVDEVGSNWSNVGGSTSPDYRTAERINRDEWHTYSGLERDGIMGTPGAKNSEPEKAVRSSGTGGSSSSGGGGSGSSSGDEQTRSYCSQDDLNSPTRIVYINEVAWAGTASSTSEEWLELYTPVQGGLSLSGWELLDKGGEVVVEFGSTERIDQYLLLRRILTTDNPRESYNVGGVDVDTAYTGTLQNDDETLRLFDASCNLVDEVVDVGSGWTNIGGSAAPDYRSAERTGPDGWQTYLGDGENGIMGTPRSENSAGDPDGGTNGDGEGDEEDDGEGDEGAGEEEGAEDGDEEVSLEITEVVYDVEGADEGQERVTITSGATSTALIETYSLQYLKVEGSFEDVKKKNFETGDEIVGRGEFVVGMSCSGAVPCEGVDMSWSQALGNDGGTVYLVRDQEVIEDGADVDVVHSYQYGS